MLIIVHHPALPIRPVTVTVTVTTRFALSAPLFEQNKIIIILSFVSSVRFFFLAFFYLLIFSPSDNRSLFYIHHRRGFIPVV